MEEANLIQYEYTMPDTPDENRLIINMDAADASEDAHSVCDEFIHGELTTTSACHPIPSFDMFTSTPPMSAASCWYKMPATENNYIPTAIEPACTAAANQLTETSGTGEKQDSADRSFLMDSILGLEQHCYSPRHSTPAKDVSHASFPQTTETGMSLNSKVTDNYPNVNSVLNLKPADGTKNSHMYKRQADKPPYSYVSMIIVAILNSKKKQLALAGIREELVDMFPFFTGEYTGWKNSIRHALSNSKAFYKVEKVDELNNATVYEWKVNCRFVKPFMFNRNSKGTNYEHYRLTLQEELGLPPYDPAVQSYHLSNEDIQLPPKPCFQMDSVSFTGSVSDDFLNARNDSVPTPQSTVSDIDSVYSGCSSVQDSKTRKRKRTEDNQPTQQTTNASKRQYVAMEQQYPYYGYPQSMEYVRPYDPYFSYNPTSNITSSQQWPHDYHQYGYPQQTFSSAQPLNFGSSSDDSWRHWWFNQAYYYGMAHNNLTPYSNNSDCYPSAALNLTKSDVQEK